MNLKTAKSCGNCCYQKRENPPSTFYKCTKQNKDTISTKCYSTTDFNIWEWVCDEHEYRKRVRRPIKI